MLFDFTPQDREARPPATTPEPDAELHLQLRQRVLAAYDRMISDGATRTEALNEAVLAFKRATEVNSAPGAPCAHCGNHDGIVIRYGVAEPDVTALHKDCYAAYYNARFLTGINFINKALEER